MVTDGASAIFLLSQYAQHAVRAQARAIAEDLRDAVERWLNEGDGSMSPRTHSSPRGPQLLNRSPLRKVAAIGVEVLEERRHFALQKLSQLRMFTESGEQTLWIESIEKLLLSGPLSSSPDLSDARRARLARPHSARTSPRNFDLTMTGTAESNDNDGTVFLRQRSRSYSFIL
jgi:hypothetical protein